MQPITTHDHSMTAGPNRKLDVRFTASFWESEQQNLSKLTAIDKRVGVKRNYAEKHADHAGSQSKIGPQSKYPFRLL